MEGLVGPVDPAFGISNKDGVGCRIESRQLPVYLLILPGFLADINMKYHCAAGALAGTAVTRQRNQRFSTGEWQGYSNDTFADAPESTERIASAGSAEPGAPLRAPSSQIDR